MTYKIVYWDDAWLYVKKFISKISVLFINFINNL